MPIDVLTEEMIKEAVKIAVEKDYEREVVHIAKEDRHTFSEEFAKKMEELLNEYTPNLKRRRKKKMAIKYLLVAILILLMSGMTVLAIPGVRERIAKYSETSFLNHTDIQFDLPIEEMEGDEDFEIYRPTYIPKGYTFEEEGYSDIFNRNWICYVNKDGIALHFQQYLPQAMKDVNISITSNGEPAEEFELNGYPVYHLVDEKGANTLIYVKEDYIYITSGIIEAEELIKVLESIKKE